MADEAAKAFGKLSIPWGVEGSQALVCNGCKTSKRPFVLTSLRRKTNCVVKA